MKIFIVLIIIAVVFIIIGVPFYLFYPWFKDIIDD